MLGLEGKGETKEGDGGLGLPGTNATNRASSPPCPWPDEASLSAACHAGSWMASPAAWLP